MRTIYNKHTGEILGIVSGVNAVDDSDDEGFIEGQYDALLYKVVDGGAVEKTDSDKQLYDVERNSHTMDSLRHERDKLLAASDWTQVPDAPVDQAAWAAYRQALRDLPENTTDPANPIWPSKPS